MANDTESGRAICPYFLRVNTLKNGRAIIACEGIVGQTETFNMFRSKKAMERWSQENCETYRYGKCRIAQMLDMKYEGGEAFRAESLAALKVKKRNEEPIRGQVSMFELDAMEEERDGY